MEQDRLCTYYMFWVCVCSLHYPHAKRMRRIILLSVTCPSVPYFYTLLRKWHHFRKTLLNIKYVLLSTQHLSETFLVLRRKETWHDHKLVLVFMLSTRYFCQILMKLEVSRQIFGKVFSTDLRKRFLDRSSEKVSRQIFGKVFSTDLRKRFLDRSSESSENFSRQIFGKVFSTDLRKSFLDRSSKMFSRQIFEKVFSTDLRKRFLDRSSKNT
jgi:hypothetical protein